MDVVIVDALLDTLILALPLFAANVLIELLEHAAVGKIRPEKALKGGLAPLIGAGVGLLPQCGFSVVAAKLYSSRHISLGALLAVFVATSDEAVPILLSNPSAAIKLLPLLGVKFLAALILGYGVSLILSRREKKRLMPIAEGESFHAVGCHGHEITDDEEHEHENGHEHGRDHAHEHIHEGDAHEIEHTHSDDEGERITSETADTAEKATEETEGTTAEEAEKRRKALKRKRLLERYLWHPLLHTLTVLLYVLAVNFILGTVIHFVDEDRLSAFMNGSRLLQPLLSAIVGLIPNCASSVAITQLYAAGTLGLGGAVSGLCVNAGLGLAVLFKENKNMKENFAAAALLFVFGIAVGMLTEAVMMAAGW